MNYWINKLQDEELVKYAAFVYKIEFMDSTYYVGFKTLTQKKTRVINGKRKRITALKTDVNDYCSSSPDVQRRCATEPFTKTILSYHSTKFDAQLREAELILQNRRDPLALNRYLGIRGKLPAPKPNKKAA